MAYKKYIQRNGKLYGPYIYSSKRIDGKVVSEYYGSKGIEWRNYKKPLFIFIGILFFAALVYFFAFSNHKITGGVVLGVDTSYENGKPLTGVLKFSLKQGELIPESSKVVFENAGNTYEFPLIDLFNETLSEGNYYVSGENIPGAGLGYGIEGEKTIYPDVEFVLQIYSNATGTETLPNETTSTEIASNNSEVISTKTTQEVVSNESTQTETTVQTTPESTTATEPATQTTSEPTTPESSSSPITGNVVKSSGGFFSSIFGLTGNVVSMELQTEVEGSASKDKPFVYNLKEGETAELKLKSVKSGDKELDDNAVSLKIENGQAIVTTDYSEIQKGYGQDYTGNKEKVISLDLSNLNLSLEQGNLTIKLVYGGNEIIQIATNLKEGGKTSNETAANTKGNNESNVTPAVTEILNETIIVNNTTNEDNISTLGNTSIFLTDAERKILLDKFGNTTLQVTKSELLNGRIMIDYNFSWCIIKYPDRYPYGCSIEHTYDYPLSNETLNLQMNNDGIQFLKDIAKSISTEETSPIPYGNGNKTFTPF
jgi:hypothetical protein